jgi:hypothetical protein
MEFPIYVDFYASFLTSVTLGGGYPIIACLHEDGELVAPASPICRIAYLDFVECFLAKQKPS